MYWWLNITSIYEFTYTVFWSGFCQAIQIFRVNAQECQLGPPQTPLAPVPSGGTNDRRMTETSFIFFHDAF